MIIKRKETSRRRGAVIVMVAASLITLLLVGSLAVDVGYICALTAEQQNNADAGALAGASGLQDEDWREAHRRAITILALNQRPQGYESLEDQIIEFGWFDSVNNKFHVVDDLERAFAVRVRAARNRVPLFFAAIAGHTETDVWRQAVAVGSKPCGGIWGLEGITAGSIWTDSFDSTVKPYDADSAGNEGDLCSGRHIRVYGSIEVHGDIMAGFGYGVSVDGNSGTITGLTTANNRGVQAPPTDFGNVAYVNDNGTIGLTDSGVSPWNGEGWNLSLQGGDNLTLEAGTYYVDSINLSGNSALTVTGPTTIYVSGNVDATGGALVNSTANPANLTIISTGTAFKSTGGANFYGQVLAPNADVVLSGNDVGWYGALIGRTVALKGDFTFHVDESPVRAAAVPASHAVPRSIGVR